MPLIYPASVGFGTPANNGGTSASSYTLTLSGVVPGQPIIICHTGANTSSDITSITDTFSTSYTYTRAIGLNENGQDCEIWVGTGGAGTSGVITVHIAATDIAGGVALPCTGAALSPGLAFLQDPTGISTNSGTGTSLAGVALTVQAPGSAIVQVLFAGGGGGPLTAEPGSPWTNQLMKVSSSTYGVTSYQTDISTYTEPTATQTSSDDWTACAVIVPPALGPPLPIMTMNQANQLASFW